MKKISLFLISIFCICLISACSSKEDSIEIQNTQINDFSEKNTENKSIDDKISYVDLEYDEINKNLTLLDLGLNQVLQEVPVESTETIDAYQKIKDGYAIVKSTFEEDVDNAKQVNGIIISKDSSDYKTSYEFISYDEKLQEKNVIDLKSMISEELMTEIQESQPEPKIDPLGHHIAWSTINGIYVLNVESGEQKVHEIEEDGFSGYEIAFIDENKVGFYQQKGETTVTTRYGYWDLSTDQIVYEEEDDYSPSQIRVSGECLVLNDSEDPATHSSSGKVVIYDCQKNQSNVFLVDNTESTFATVTSDGAYLIVYVCLDNELMKHRVRIYQLSSKECVNEIPFSTEKGVRFYDFCNSENDYLLIGNGDAGKVVYHVFAAK